MYCAAIFVLSSLEQPPQTVTFLPDKLGHIVLYAGLGFLVARWLIGSGFEGKAASVILPALFCFLYGITDEFHQSFVPGRTAEAGDVIADGMGGLLGACAYTGLRLWTRWPRRASQETGTDSK
jgi:VanZ family protein